VRIDRRTFLKSTLAGASAFLLPPGIRPAGAAAGGEPVVVALFLRGGADPLSLIVPRGDPDYYDIRPTIHVPPGTEIDLDGFFGFHPALAPLLPLYQTGRMAVLHAAGSPDPSRSHFDAQDFMETAAPGDKSVVDGWLNRFLGLVGGGDPLSGVSLRKSAARSLAGPVPNVAFQSVEGFRIEGSFPSERRAALEDLYAVLGDPPLGGSMGSAFAALDRVGAVDVTTGVAYPPGELGALLADAAALIKAEVGVKVVTVDAGGWDHHSDQLARIEPLAGGLAGALAAFYEDLAACGDQVVTVVMTEFGRRAGENGAGGSDHGHGGMMLVLGGAVAGGRVVLRNGVWPGLKPGDLFGGQDLQVTTDFREVFAEVLVRHMGVDSIASVFPGFSPDPANYPGLFG
jgi:uncharacterized protein (DUF1501 family)